MKNVHIHIHTIHYSLNYLIRLIHCSLIMNCCALKEQVAQPESRIMGLAVSRVCEIEGRGIGLTITVDCKIAGTNPAGTRHERSKARHGTGTHRNAPGTP